MAAREVASGDARFLEYLPRLGTARCRNRRTLLLRALGFAALRMAQGAYELGLGQQHPSNLVMAMLQLAANMLTEPRAASLHLFGIPVPWRPERAPGRR